MKKIISSLAVFGALFCAANAVADNHQMQGQMAGSPDGDSKFTLDTKVGFYSDYIFRGQNLYDGTSIQPEATLGADLGDMGTVSAGVWAHVAGEDNEGVSDANEVDFSLDYTIGVLDNVDLSVGHLWYTYNDDAVQDSNEYYASLALDVVTSPVFTYYRDYDELDTNYFELGLSHKFEDTCGMGEGFNATPHITLGFTDENNSVYAESGLVQVTLGVSSDLKLGHIDVTPSFHYTFESDDTVDDQFWFGVTLGHLFDL